MEFLAAVQGTTRPAQKLLLSITAAAEAATGLMLVVAPSLLAELLLGVAPGTPAGITVSRVAGAALLALGVACWLARKDAEGHTATGLVAAMLAYNLAVVAILVHAWTSLGLSGVALWPAVRSWGIRDWPSGASPT